MYMYIGAQSQTDGSAEGETDLRGARVVRVFAADAGSLAHVVVTVVALVALAAARVLQPING